MVTCAQLTWHWQRRAAALLPLLRSPRGSQQLQYPSLVPQLLLQQIIKYTYRSTVHYFAGKISISHNFLYPSCWGTRPVAVPATSTASSSPQLAAASHHPRKRPHSGHYRKRHAQHILLITNTLRVTLSIIESWTELEGTFKGLLELNSRQWSGTSTAASGAPSPFQPDFECLKRQATHHLSGQSVPEPHHPYRKKLFPYIQSKPFLF